ncbi:MAG: hypothetical protein A2275_05465 [Bacteroidetes bacterium RIFOXYA12_FULL_35_11]|nr:MAG: hypothetical protein A2X01_10665 [Bacteroidetes bacterium GWF2_35_48]OFY73837.1 MAG: hypothetical protein A2275_05465 [Bacteroidetes bacterium RIFOXYA12_FULL_35_11]OFZ03191.1 MAG: hypothetical protein A2491_18395 [Bacteroidetes bacterium RIFOXYC12_FULL_35_7]HBX49888.1 hemerythrin [Bacteroidales bacterium]
MSKLWKESYALNIKEIDNQHIELFKILEELLNAMSQGQGNQVVLKIINNLENYARMHFGIEEKYMQKFGYEKFQDHFEAHQYFYKKMAECKQAFQSNNLIVTKDLMDFLNKWIVKHICGTDTLYKELFIQNNVR